MYKLSVWHRANKIKKANSLNTNDLLQRPGGESKDIWEAARKGDIKAVKHHLDAGVDVNLKDEFGKLTPLHEAATYGHKEVAELLIAAGADVNAEITSVKFRGETALDWAIAFKETELTDLLRKHGAKTGEELKAAGK